MMPQENWDDTRHSIKAVMESFPDLTSNGFGLGGLTKGEERQQKLRRYRDEMLDENHCAQFERARAWLATQRPIKTINTDRSSYGLKHVVERWHRGVEWSSRGDCYVSNGMFIAAALSMGFKAKRIDRFDCPNCHFNISKKSISATERDL